MNEKIQILLNNCIHDINRVIEFNESENVTDEEFEEFMILYDNILNRLNDIKEYAINCRDDNCLEFVESLIKLLTNIKSTIINWVNE